MTDDRARLEQLLAEAEQNVTALKHVLGLMGRAPSNGNGHIPAQPSELEGAMARASIGSGMTKRTEMAAFLDAFDRTEPRPAYGHRRVGAAVRYGYLKPKGEGYVRTAKDYTA